ncbi:MAG: AGE family epimerase/isomerase, partial [Bacteroidia bacterium]|nr:AGE family epimerase/isomerase [Bacteroidia bacterium]
LPDGRPVYAGTYYPKNDWMNILNQIVKLKNEDLGRLEQTASQLTDGINNSNLITVSDKEINFSKEDMQSYIKRALVLYDRRHGGRSGSPKFPMPNSYEFLMKYHWLTGDTDAREVTELGLDKMAKGGIYDQLGGGFARYSVDATWLVPHFEKMLYDNGQLVSVYAQAYKLFGKPLYKEVVENTIAFVERELMSEEYGFYSSLDADSEGKEGKFYVWSQFEIDSLLTDENARNAFKEYYDVSSGGNWEFHNILNIVKDKNTRADSLNISVETLETWLKESKEILFEARSKRIRPGLDDKILTSWNALMMAGYLDAYDALGNPDYLQMAMNNASFILDKQMQKDGRLNRNYKDGKSNINAFLDDYALTAHAFLKLYEATFDIQWIEHAEKLVSYCMDHFYNNDNKMFNYTSDLDPALIAKKSEYNDNVIPASNSSMARVLHKLGTLRYNKEYIGNAEQMMKNMIEQVIGNDYLSFYSNWMQLLFDISRSPYEVAIVGSDALDLRNELAQKYTANTIYLGSTKEENLDLLKGKYLEGTTMIYVCQDKVCKLPVEASNKALELMTP